MKFEKYHGLGNDFIIFNYKDVKNIKDLSKLAIKICDRHTGIGADGMIILVEKKETAQMIFYNSDGSLGEMCGNGIRCFSHYIYNNNSLNGTTYKIETLAGLLSLDIYPNETFEVKVNMGKPLLETKSIPMSICKDEFIDEEIQIFDKTYNISSIFMGVPHSVIFVENLKDIDIEKVGKVIENHKLFPKKTNVNFVQVLNKDEIIIETWERGAGHTLACGTGSCASAVVGNILGILSNEVKVHLTIGDLIINLNDNVFMTGPSKLIAKGEYFI